MRLDKENGKETKKGLLKGIGMMGACCLIPIIIMALLPLLSSTLGLTGTRIASILTSLICPVMMIVMMLTMSKGKSCCAKDDKNKSDE